MSFSRSATAPRADQVGGHTAGTDVVVDATSDIELYRLKVKEEQKVAASYWLQAQQASPQAVLKACVNCEVGRHARSGRTALRPRNQARRRDVATHDQARDPFASRLQEIDSDLRHDWDSELSHGGRQNSNNSVSARDFLRGETDGEWT